MCICVRLTSARCLNFLSGMMGRFHRLLMLMSWGGRGHGGLQVVVVAEGSSGHPDGKPHPAHPRTLQRCGHKQQRCTLLSKNVAVFCVAEPKP